MDKYMKCMYLSLKGDFNFFLRSFEVHESFNYADFANIWQRKHFTFIYADQNDLRFLPLHCEMCFTIIKTFIMQHPNIYGQIGAFYLLYGLFYKQPINQLVQIRLTLDEYCKIKSLMDIMLEKGQYDALYIFVKMKTDEAFSYIAQPNVLNLAAKFNYESVDTNNVVPKKVPQRQAMQNFRNICNDSHVVTLDKTCREYDEKLKSFAKKHPGLTLFQTSIIEDLKKIQSLVFSDSITEQTTEAVVEESSIKNVKEKAMRNKNAEYRGSRKVITAADVRESPHQSRRAVSKF